MSTLQMDVPINNQTQSDALRTVIHDFRESINHSNHNAQPMTEEEFSQFISYIRGRVFPQNSSSLQASNQNSREILVELLRQSQNQTEFLRRITDALSNIRETGLIIKLSIVFAFVWTMNKFLNQK